MLIVVVGIAFTMLISTFNVVGGVDTRSRTNNEVRQAVQQIDRLVRSGNILYDPALESNDPGNHLAPGLTMRVYTQANGNQRCVQWRINDGRLEMRSWSESWQFDGVVSTWSGVAEHIVNTTSNPAFSLDSASGFGDRLLKIRVIADLSATDNSPAVEVRASVAGRNTTYGYSNSVCSVIPPY